ncbi:unnamed protein product, partial [Symbiodinium necroappetens]
DRKGPLVPVGCYTELPAPRDLGHDHEDAEKKLAEKEDQAGSKTGPGRGNGRGRGRGRGKRAAALDSPPSKRIKAAEAAEQLQEDQEAEESAKPQSPKPEKSAKPKQSPKKKSAKPKQSPKKKSAEPQSPEKKSAKPKQSPKPKKSAEPQSPKPKKSKPKQTLKPKKSAEPKQIPEPKKSTKSGQAVATKDSKDPEPDRPRVESNLLRIMKELPIATPASALHVGFHAKDFLQKSYTKYISADEKAKLPPEHQSEVKGIEVNLYCNKFYVKRVLVTSWDGMPEDLVCVTRL